MVLAIFSVPSILRSPIPPDKEQKNSDFGYDLESSAVSWNTSDYINFTKPAFDQSEGRGIYEFRIFIDETNSSYTWDKTAAENEWCTGSGTYSDPYVIENLYINGQGSGGMIYIRHSKKYFIIRNCWFNYSGADGYDNGVCLHWTGNGTIDNNIFTYTRKGVNIETQSYNNTVSNNIMISDHTTAGLSRAIHVGGEASNVTIINNKIRNHYSAIYVGGGYQFTVTNSIIKGNYLENTLKGKDYRGTPMHCIKISYCQIVGNIFAGDLAYGSFEVFGIKEEDCIGNIILNNTVVVNETLEFGPKTSGALSVNTFKLRTAQTSLNSPISLETCRYNYIAHNIMLIPPDGDQAIPGYETFLILGLISIISVVILKKIMKK
ncbi:MAG: right-handed parallel beta-helix repeat-containing protein [Candidatus Lokiarchaeia archaeon]